MARIEKTIFISYRRKDISWALAVYQYLTSQKYDVFFDYTSIPSGDFEQIIVSNIKARAHFVLILTPTALDRCSQPGDWLRREIETAVDEKRNIIPLLFDGFNFGSPSVIEKLTGKLAAIPRYNALDIPSGYFIEAMERLRSRYLNVPLNAVIHPVSTEVRKVVQEEQVAADKALEQKKEDIEELVKPVEERPLKQKQTEAEKATKFPSPNRRGARSEVKTANLRPYGIGAGILLIAALGVFIINSLIHNGAGNETPMPTFISQLSPGSTNTSAPVTPTQSISTNIETPTSLLNTPTLPAGTTRVSPIDNTTLVYIPAGQFTMGLTSEQVDTLRPLCNSIAACEELLTNSHTYNVELSDFWISQTEVSNGSYALCVTSGGCTEPQSKSEEYSNSNYFALTYLSNYPVVWVSWQQAREYCNWAGGDLPTSAQWEYAARGNDGRLFPWGDTIPDANHANVNNFYDQPRPVNDFKDYPSPFGLLNTSGNVWEWTLDSYDPNFYASNTSLVDPMVNSDEYIINGSSAKVIRGSSAWFPSVFASVAVQDWEYPDNPNFGIGFRCVVDVP